MRNCSALSIPLASRRRLNELSHLYIRFSSRHGAPSAMPVAEYQRRSATPSPTTANSSSSGSSSTSLVNFLSKIQTLTGVTASSDSASTTPAAVATLFIPNSALDKNGAQLTIDQDDIGQNVTTYAITDEFETRKYHCSECLTAVSTSSLLLGSFVANSQGFVETLVNFEGTAVFTCTYGSHHDSAQCVDHGLFDADVTTTNLKLVSLETTVG
jgi:cytoskeletal protein RodZ